MKKEPGFFCNTGSFERQGYSAEMGTNNKMVSTAEQKNTSNKQTQYFSFFLLLIFFFFIKSYSKKESSLSGFQLFTYCVLRFSNPLLNDRISNNLFRSSIIKPFLFKSKRDYKCVSQLRVEQTAATSKKIHQV